MSAMPEHVPVLTDVVAEVESARAGAAAAAGLRLDDGPGEDSGAGHGTKIPLELIPVLADRIPASPEGQALEPAEGQFSSAASTSPSSSASPLAIAESGVTAHQAANIDRKALEAVLLQGLKASVAQMLEVRVQAAVTPALALLADRLAYKASQELAATLTDSMQEELMAAVREAVDAALDRPKH